MRFPAKESPGGSGDLSDPTARGNLQAVRMLYALRCLDAPQDFKGQLELLESLQFAGYPVSPQQKLELALLLHQCGHYQDGEKLFKKLQELWRTGEYYVQVPERLHWLMNADGSSRRQVSARVTPGGERRGFAKVREMKDTVVRFIAEEFGQRNIRPRTEIRGYIWFTHNGPNLHPLTDTASQCLVLQKTLPNGSAGPSLGEMLLLRVPTM